MQFEKWQALGNDYLIVEAGAAAVGADPRAGAADLRAALRRRLRRRAAALTQRGPGSGRRAADLQPGRLGGRAVGQRRARGDPLPAPARLDRRGHVLDRHRGGPITPTITSERTCSVEMGRASTVSATTPRVGLTARGTLRAAGRDWTFQHVSIGNPQCAIEVGERARGSRPGGDRTGDRRTRAVPEPHQRVVLCGSTAVACGRGSSSAGWGRRSRRGRAPAAPPWPHSCGGAASPITVELDGGELEVEVSDELDVRLSGWAEPVCSGELSPELLSALADL